jgi:hypothetical protein
MLKKSGNRFCFPTVSLLGEFTPYMSGSQIWAPSIISLWPISGIASILSLTSRSPGSPPLPVRTDCPGDSRLHRLQFELSFREAPAVDGGSGLAPSGRVLSSPTVARSIHIPCSHSSSFQPHNLVRKFLDSHFDDAYIGVAASIV